MVTSFELSGFFANPSSSRARSSIPATRTGLSPGFSNTSSTVELGPPFTAETHTRPCLVSSSILVTMMAPSADSPDLRPLSIPSSSPFTVSFVASTVFSATFCATSLQPVTSRSASRAAERFMRAK
ncbi:MAG: hypothetical protein AAGA56_28540 [Myxococcota bacterium]